MFWVYILECADQTYYTGHTDNLENRVAQHAYGFFADCYTAIRLPVKLVYSQELFSREEAISAERQIKGWSHRKKTALINGDWNAVSAYAKRKKISEDKSAVHASRRRKKRASSARTVERGN